MSIYHPPFVVNDAYARSSGLSDPSVLWTLMAPGVWVMEKRLSNDEFMMISQVATLTHEDKDKINGAKVADFYRPCYKIGMIEAVGVLDFSNVSARTDDAPPVSWWLRVDLVPASERVRYPALPSKINMTEGLDLGDVRELYSWDGTGFKLRDPAWGMG
jgi:hypothetical protein